MNPGAHRRLTQTYETEPVTPHRLSGLDRHGDPRAIIRDHRTHPAASARADLGGGG